MTARSAGEATQRRTSSKRCSASAGGTVPPSRRRISAIATGERG
uniref:Uncharacterized protein n=1 Tax=Arundo donax TaxID=35708 RepID=A0A0A9A353_ARUDO